jgi:hypothetical protein
MRKPLAKVVAGVGAAVLAGTSAFFVAVAQRGAERILPDKPPQSSAPAALEFPFAVAVDPGFDAGMAYALPSPVTGGPAADELLAGFAGDSELAAFLRAHDGAPLLSVVPSLTFTGLIRSGSVRIVGLRVYAKQGGDVLGGSILSTVSNGVQETIPVRVDLDRASLAVTAGDGKPYFRGHGIELAADEHVTVAVTFTAAKHSYRWLMAVDYVLPAGGSRTAYVDGTGKLYQKAPEVPPRNRFALTGAAPRYAARWDTNFPQPGFRLTRR